jgi:bifunctional non-homologous end joining protein LigD
MLWRVSSRFRRNPPRDFIVPCKPVLVDQPPAGPDWLHEIKFDGYRIIACENGDRVRLWTRRGTDYTDKFPGIAAAVRSLGADQAVDGEAIVLRSDGRSDFESLPEPTWRKASGTTVGPTGGRLEVIAQNFWVEKTSPRFDWAC